MPQAYDFKTNELVDYTPTCKCGCTDCIWDPAYLAITWPAGKRYNTCDRCKDCSEYDDEDK